MKNKKIIIFLVVLITLIFFSFTDGEKVENVIYESESQNVSIIENVDFASKMTETYWIVVGPGKLEGGKCSDCYICFAFVGHIALLFLTIDDTDVYTTYYTTTIEISIGEEAIPTKIVYCNKSDGVSTTAVKPYTDTDIPLDMANEYLVKLLYKFCEGNITIKITVNNRTFLLKFENDGMEEAIEVLKNHLINKANEAPEILSVTDEFVMSLFGI